MSKIGYWYNGSGHCAIRDNSNDNHPHRLCNNETAATRGAHDLSYKPEEEHIVAISSYNSFSLLLSNRKPNTFKNEQQAAKAERLFHLTFRTRENVIRILKKEADSKGIPLSILLNNILKSHLMQTNIENASFILSSKDFFRRIFGKIDEKSLEDYGAELALAIVSEYTSSFFPDINACTIVQFLEMWFKRFQSFQHRIDEKNNRHTFSLNHDVNMNFSIVLRVILESLVEPVIKNSSHRVV
jgi:hypothetical protein